MVRSEDLPRGLIDGKGEEGSLERTPSISGSTGVYRAESSWVARSYFSSMDVEDIKRIRDRYQVLEDVVLYIPDLDKRACSSKLDNVAFYEADFNASLRFPMQPFMRELLGRLNLSPGQLAPNAWRTVISCMVMWRVCSRGADAIMVDEFLYCYKLSQITVSSGFWTFNGQQKGMKLITGLLTSNREWKDGFVFVCGDNWEDPHWEERDENFVHIRQSWGVPPSSGVFHGF